MKDDKNELKAGKAVTKEIKTADDQDIVAAKPVEKALDVVSIADAKEKVSDIKVFGDGDAWQLVCKASSADQGWMKSTKAMSVPGAGVLVQVSTQQKGLDGTYAVAEAITFVPGVHIRKNTTTGNLEILR